SECRVERRERELVRPHRARERVPPAGGDEVPPSRQDSRLWSAKELVTAEDHERCPARHALLDPRLALEPEGGEVHGQAAAEIVDQRDARRGRERSDGRY